MVATELGQMPDGVYGPLEIAVREQGTTTMICPTGEWDLVEHQRARQAIRTALERSPECVVLDLSQLTFIDSSGIHVVVELAKRSAQQHVRLVIIPGSRAVQRPFEILRLTETLPFVTNATRAMTAWSCAAVGSRAYGRRTTRRVSARLRPH